MFCPHCGKVNSAEQKFCRSCGLSLEKIAQSLAEQLPVTGSNTALEDRQRKVERWIGLLAGSAFAVFVGAVLWALIYKIIIVKGEILQGSMFLGLFVALITALILVIYRESLLEKTGKRRLSETTLPQSADTAKLLSESHIEPITSVTERTTELLFVEKKSGTK